MMIRLINILFILMQIKSLKEKIAEERGNEFPIDGQKLIYAGIVFQWFV